MIEERVLRQRYFVRFVDVGIALKSIAILCYHLSSYPTEHRREMNIPAQGI
jgi:hypothetical protein